MKKLFFVSLMALSTAAVADGYARYSNATCGYDDESCRIMYSVTKEALAEAEMIAASKCDSVVDTQLKTGLANNKLGGNAPTAFCNLFNTSLKGMK